MKKSYFALVMIMATVPVFAQVDHKVEKELLASYQKVVTSLKKKDVKGVMDMMTPDATATEMGQTLKRPQFEAMLKQNLGMMEFESSSIKFSKVAVKGDIAATEYVETSKVKIKTPDGKTSVMGMISKYKSSFQKIGKDWKMKNSETVGTPEMKVNGKKTAIPKQP